FEVPVYDMASLEPGNVVIGPALVESQDTTILVPPDALYRIDKHRNGVMEV
ncbi:MAG: hypothetical protein K6T68_07680, partial [Alicyclobacillus shizuokensis]|nr:hypothetical protein [Alicyclobacillus shizuokensis]